MTLTRLLLRNLNSVTIWDYPPIMENQMEKKMEHEMESGGV